MKPKPTHLLNLLILSLALLVAGFLRFYQFGDVPPGLNGDEAAFGIGALHLLQNGPSLYIEGQGGGGILASYIVALFFWLLEPGKMALRLQASLIGWATVPLLFFATRLIFAERGRTEAGLIAVLAALMLALSSAHATISRIAFAIIHLPFLQLLAILCFWWAYRHPQRQYFLLGGMALALVLYGYVAGIITPGIFIAFLLTATLTKRLTGEPQNGRTDESKNEKITKSKGEEDTVENSENPTPQKQASLTPKSRLLNPALFVLTFLLCALPLIFFYLSNVEAGSSGRLSEASFLSPTINQGDPWGALWRGVKGNYAAFGLGPLVWLADGNWSAFGDNIFILLAFGGLLLSLKHIKRPAAQFVLWWWGLTILPAALAPDQIPHASRAIGVYPPLSILIAWPVAELMVWLGSSLHQLWTGHRRAIHLAGAGLSLAGLIWLTSAINQATWARFTYYFEVWPHEAETIAAFDLYARHLADEMATLATSDAAFILPRNTSAGSVSPNGSVNFFYRLSQSPAPHFWVTDDEETLPDRLTAIAATATTIHLIHWKVTKHTGADPKEMLAYYLEKQGTRQGVRQFADYDIETYTLPRRGIDFAAAESLPPLNLNFGGQLALQGATFGNAGPGDATSTQVAAGQPLWARLRWQKLTDHPHDLKVSLIVQDAFKQRVTFADKHLQNNFWHQRSQAWPLETIADTAFIWPLPPDLMPGRYQIAIQVYQDETLTPLFETSTGRLTYPLGEIVVTPALSVAEMSPPDPTAQQLTAPESPLQLYLSEMAFPETWLPGQQLDLNLTWQAQTPLTRTVALRVDLRQGETVIPLVREQPVGGGHYPTTKWRTGETLHQHLAATIPPKTDGDHTLEIALLTEGEVIQRWPIQPITVQNWTHSHTLPTTAHPTAANFGDFDLVGYETQVDETTQTLHLTLYWQAETPLTTPYKTFVHLLNQDGQIVAQVDHLPGDGAYPSPGWPPGDIIADTFTLPLPAETAVSSLSVGVGVYAANDFARLAAQVADQDVTRVPLPLILDGGPAE